MNKIFFLLAFFLVLFNTDSFSQKIDFVRYRYVHIDTSQLGDYTKSAKKKSMLNGWYSKLYLKKQNIEYLYLLNNSAIDSIKNHSIKDARKLLADNIALANRIHQHSYEKAYSFYLLSDTYARERNYNKMAEYANLFKEEIVYINPDSTFLSLVYSYSAKCNFAARNIEIGFKDFDISNKIAEEFQLFYILQDNYTNAGNILTFYEPEQASKFLDYALILSNKNNYITPYDVVYLYLINGASYMARDVFEIAIERFQYALMVLKRDSVSSPRFEMVLNYYLASSYRWEKEYEKAIAQVDFFRKGKTYTSMGLSILGDVYYSQQKYDSAIGYYQQYYSNLLKQNHGKSSIKALFILDRIANCNSSMGNLELAKKQYRECLFKMAGDTVIEKNKLLPIYTPTDNSSYTYWHTLISDYTQLIQKEFYNNKYNLNDVVSCYCSDLNSFNDKIFIKQNMESKFKFSSMAKETAMQLLDFLSTQKDIPDTVLDAVWNAVAFSKNNYFNSEFSKENTSLELKTSEQFRYDSLRNQLNKIVEFPDNELDKVRENLNCVKDIFVLSYNKKAELLYPSIELSVCIDSSINSLRASESIIDYYSNDSNIYYFTYIDGKKKFCKVKDTNIFRNIKQFSRSVKSGGEPKTAINNALFVELGLSKVLKSQHSLYFIPDIDLATFPIEILKYNNGKYILEENNITYLYSASQISKRVNKTNFKNEISCFAPGFVQNDDAIAANRNSEKDIDNISYLQPLPYSISECERIADSFNSNFTTSLRIEDSATTNNFFKAITNSKILHIATHGIASKNSLNNTGIYLYNDTLGIDFISFDKIKNNSIKSELTVLSACKTAEGVNIKGEGKMSLSYGFMFAGSKNVVASLWYVSDKVTQNLMMKFYENINTKNMSYSVALQRAKLDLLHQGYSPLDWGSFIFLGKR